MKKFIYLVVLFLSATIISGNLFAGQCSVCCSNLSAKKRPYDFSFNSCNAKLTFKVRTVGRDGFDLVAVNDYDIYYKYNGQSSWIHLLKFDIDAISGGGSDTYTWGLSPTITISHARYGGAAIVMTEFKNTNNAGQTVTWTVPNTVLENGGLEFKIERKQSGIGDVDKCTEPATGYDNTNDVFSITTIPSYDAPTNLTASNGDECTGVNLTWANPGDGPSCTPAVVNEIEIQKKKQGTSSWTSAGTVAFSYSQPFLCPVSFDGTYEFRVRAKYGIGNNRTMYSDYSTVATGYRKTPPPAPTSFNASNSNCDGTIELTWTNAPGTDDNYIRWSGGSTGSEDDITGTSYTLSGVSRGSTYTFDIFGNNICGRDNGSYTTTTGISPADPTAPSNLSISQNAGNINLTWTDAQNETEYKIERSIVGGAGLTTFDNISANATSFTDTTADLCQTYSYIVKAINDCKPNGVSSNAQNVIIVADLSNVFTQGNFTASKGYYTNRVELTWSTNISNSIIDGYRIYRKRLDAPASDDSTLITTINTSASNVYIDNYIDAGVLYQYWIIAEGDCDGTTYLSNIVSTIGFKSSSGIINGEVNYGTGTPVEGVKVIAENISGSSGSAIHFDGMSSIENAIPNFDDTITGALTIEAWVKLGAAPTSGWNVLSDYTHGRFKLGGDASTVFFSVKNNAGTELKASVPISTININQFVHLAGVYGENTGEVKLYINGQEVAVYNAGGAVADIQLRSIAIGDSLEGTIDEARFWLEARDSAQIAQNFNRAMSGNESNLIGFWNFDEGIGDFTYDKSHDGNTYNRNHLAFNNMVTWDTLIPPSSLLSYSAYTNTAGDYTIVVPYTGVGNNFTVTPIFGTHVFNPSNTVLYIGNGSPVINNVDFIDESSFPVSGQVYYYGTNCPVVGASLKIDNQVALSPSNTPVTTDNLGHFDIEVPIGQHFVTIEKNGHVFSAGRFPPTGFYDFQAPVNGIQFTDSTLVKVVGRVVGGLREANKIPGLGKSKNNIGVAQIILSTQNNCLRDTILTDPITGEYSTYLPPMKFVPDVSVLNNNDADYYFQSSTLDLVDLNNYLNEKTAYDTLSYDSLNSTYLIDSVIYNKELNYVYRKTPSLVVKGTGNVLGAVGNDIFMGDTSLKINNYGGTGAPFEISLMPGQSPFDFDVFTQRHENDENFQYSALIGAFEEYFNYDASAINPTADSVPVSDGKIFIDNQLAKKPITSVDLSDIAQNADDIAYLYYKFEPGAPLSPFAVNTSIPSYSFTKKMEVILQMPDGSSVAWLPGTNPLSGAPDVYRAYLLGGQNMDNTFLTFGPETVDFVLRDPPGGNSSASREIGSSISSSESYGWNLGGNTNFTDNVYLGSKFSFGFGLETETDQEASVSIGFQSNVSGGRSGSLERVVTSTQEWSTNDDAANIGGGSDVFLGHSTNIEFGITNNLQLVPDSMCSSIDCLLSFGNGFSAAETHSLSIVPKGYNTGFIYTQNFIETIKIPELINLRNIFLQNDSRYQSNLPIGDPNYGKNNDDPDFGSGATMDSKKLDIPQDYDGLSYVYTPVTPSDSLNDTIRLLNQQIRLWEKAIWQNEFEKVNISNQVVLDSLRDFELAKLDSQYLLTEIAFATLQTAAGTGAATATLLNGLLTTVTPSPGFAAANSITLAATTATNIAAVELTDEHLTYLNKRQEILDRFANITSVNHSISGGVTYTNSISSEKTVTETETFEFGMNASIEAAFHLKVSNTGVGLSKGLSVDFSRESSWDNSTTTSNTVSYTLGDGDNADFFSVDVFPSMFGWGPIFKRRQGGKTSCPHELAEETQYYQPGTVISEGTLQRDKPGIEVGQSLITNVPVDQAAVFNLTITNLTETGDDMPYVVKPLVSSNPNGAIVRINGLGSQTPMVPAGTSINMPMTIEKGPGGVYDYDSIIIVVHSLCQYDYGISPIYKDIVDSVYVSAHFIPTCTDVELANPQDNWVLNNSFNDTLPLVGAGYDINFFDLDRLRFEYKPSSAANWIGLESFWKDTTGLGNPMAQEISTSSNFTFYDWDVSQLPDGNYDLRLTSLCSLADVNSQIYSGVMDRINPHPFGTPAPADGILDANEDIMIRFNEPIDLGALNYSNFDIRGVLNGTDINNSTSLYFDGLTNYVEIPAGVALQSRDFTLEFWAKRDALGEQTILSQGGDAQENLFVGFNTAEEFVVRFGAEELSSGVAVTDNLWHHYAVVYNFDNETMELYQDAVLLNPGNVAMYPDYVASGKVLIGQNSIGGNNFSGNISQVRVWNVDKSQSQIASNMSKKLSGSETGILYNWNFDEATGTILKDQIRKREALVNGATWQVSPSGNALVFDGTDDYVSIESGNMPINKEMDFTLEFWFNSANAGTATLFSNGSGSSAQADSTLSMVIEKDATGQIHILYNGNDFVAVNTNYFDGNWHHFALVLQRSGNLTAYIDGNIQNSIPSLDFDEIGGNTFYVGAHGQMLSGGMDTTYNYFDGMIDEFRFWNLSRKVEQIQRDKQNRLLGDELGLQSYLPNEAYSLVLGVPVLSAITDDIADTSHQVLLTNGAATTTQTPTIKLQRPIQEVNFVYSVNNDEIILTPTTSPELIENVTLDITVEGVQDLHGNVMQSPKTWIAYMDKNQVIWQDDMLSFTKSFGDNLNFSSAVVNNGGSAKVFTIENIPDWLSVTPTTGTVAPNGVVSVEFTVDPGTNIGDYLEDIHLLTDFGYPEKLSIDLTVRDEEPDWIVNPADFEYSMSIIGMLKMEGVVSTDEEDMLAAFVDNETRGVCHLEYIPAVDKYLAFIDVYSNSTTGDSLRFKIWDASKGSMYIDVVPELVFESDNIIGTVSNPQLFEAGNTVAQNIYLNAGWNWISFNLLSSDSMDLDKLMESVDFSTGNELKGQTHFANYNGTNGWIGSLLAEGVHPEEGYKLKVNQHDTLVLNGSIINPLDRTISLDQGWNWIGFISVRNQTIADAMGNLTPNDGDILKGKSNFAVYDSILGWIGSLNTLVPGSGYMYKSGSVKTFTFPYAGAFKSFAVPDIILNDSRWFVDAGLYSSNMTGIVSISACDEDNQNDFMLDDWYLGAFDENNQCRGLSKFDYVQNNLLTFITIAGDQSDDLHFKLVNSKTGEELEIKQNIPFTSNKALGSLDEQFNLQVKEEWCAKLFEHAANQAVVPESAFTVYPNKFDKEFTVEYSSKSASKADINLYNLWGQLVYAQTLSLEEGFNQIKIANLNLGTGMYVLELVGSDKTDEIKERIKLIKK